MVRYSDEQRLDIQEELMHYGTKRHSGRYPWGSGNNPYQRSNDFLSRVKALKEAGITKESELAKAVSLTTTQYRAQWKVAQYERRLQERMHAISLREDGHSLQTIATMMGYKNDSSIRSLLNEDIAARQDAVRGTAEFLKKRVDDVGMIEVGKGVEKELRVSREHLDQAMYMLEIDGYPKFNARVEQQTNPGKFTTFTVLAPPDTPHSAAFKYGEISSLIDYTSDDGGQTFEKLSYPSSLDSSRIKIVYGDEGGSASDGLVQLRRGVDDISLGNSQYAQVRILVDDTHYIKGMAVYSDNLPDGVDIQFNTNKPSGTPMDKVLKPITNDPDNPFGSYIPAAGQRHYIDADGNKQLSPINKPREEGDWGEWSKTLPTQFLAKQNIELIEKQVALSVYERQAEFDEIMALTNPTVKKTLLQSFADGCDSDSVGLSAAALPRQMYQVILPIPSIKDGEIYAPNYRDGEEVALIRYPHGGTFEIPILTVNNKNKTGRSMIGVDALDAVGINAKTAEQLSGADFDGDTVQVIPTGYNKRLRNEAITASKPLADMQGFDAKLQYPEVEGMSYMKYTKNGKTVDSTGAEMGKISNLITDMTIKGADPSELARAVKHSMVVIDAGKHKLNYKQSELDNGIAELKTKYQGYVDPETGKTKGGASTLFSRTSSQVSVPRYQGMPNVDPETGRVSYTEAFTPTQRPKTPDLKYSTKTGQLEPRMRKSKAGAETEDANTLSSGHPKETVYAEYSNTLKALANTARKEILRTPDIEVSPSAKKTYKAEVDDLKEQLLVAQKNAPRERQAQLIAASSVKAKRESNPDMSNGEIKKAQQLALDNARATVGAKRTPISISTNQWDAIQAGAIAKTTLQEIVKYVDTDALRTLATPRSATKMTAAKTTRLDAMIASGNYTNSEMAIALGVSPTTIGNYIKGKGQ